MPLDTPQSQDCAPTTQNYPTQKVSVAEFVNLEHCLAYNRSSINAVE